MEQVVSTDTTHISQHCGQVLMPFNLFMAKSMEDSNYVNKILILMMAKLIACQKKISRRPVCLNERATTSDNIVYVYLTSSSTHLIRYGSWHIDACMRRTTI